MPAAQFVRGLRFCLYQGLRRCYACRPTADERAHPAREAKAHTPGAAPAMLEQRRHIEQQGRRSLCHDGRNGAGRQAVELRFRRNSVEIMRTQYDVCSAQIQKHAVAAGVSFMHRVVIVGEKIEVEHPTQLMTTILATASIAQPKAPTCPSEGAAAAMRTQRIEFMVDGA